MITITPDAESRRITAAFAAMAKSKIKTAVAISLTKTADAVVTAEQTKMKRVLDRPRPFTINAVKRLSASKSDTPIKATVFIMDAQSVPTPTAKYLAPYEFGGVNVLNKGSKALLKPVKNPTDRFGNLPWATIKRLAGGQAKGRNGKMYSWKGRGDIYVGWLTPKGSQPIWGVWQRPYKSPLTDRRRPGSGKFGAIGKKDKKSNLSGHFILLIRGEDAHPIASKNRLHWFETADKVITYVGARELRNNFRKYLPAALRLG